MMTEGVFDRRREGARSVILNKLPHFSNNVEEVKDWMDIFLQNAVNAEKKEEELNEIKKQMQKIEEEVKKLSASNIMIKEESEDLKTKFKHKCDTYNDMSRLWTHINYVQIRLKDLQQHMEKLEEENSGLRMEQSALFQKLEEAYALRMVKVLESAEPNELLTVIHRTNDCWRGLRKTLHEFEMHMGFKPLRASALSMEDINLSDMDCVVAEQNNESKQKLKEQNRKETHSLSFAPVEYLLSPTYKSTDVSAMQEAGNYLRGDHEQFKPIAHHQKEQAIEEQKEETGSGDLEDELEKDTAKLLRNNDKEKTVKLTKSQQKEQTRKEKKKEKLEPRKLGNKAKEDRELPSESKLTGFEKCSSCGHKIPNLYAHRDCVCCLRAAHLNINCTVFAAFN
ncbi:spindle pole body component 110-like [Protopterus annectens]|uniref:spindle pole body component 110-like n=1 Tax=Protopterus annectens TaxID=7888 RepID=UPI001CF9E7F2|nr:spindle pole body component 110-like [Protopterus annectens]